MRYTTRIDDRNYSIELKNNELLMIDSIAENLATMFAHKTYGKRRGAAISVTETRSGRGVQPLRRFWTYDAVVARLGKLDTIVERQWVTFQIDELPSKSPRIAKAKKSLPIESKTLKDVLD